MEQSSGYFQYYNKQERKLLYKGIDINYSDYPDDWDMAGKFAKANGDKFYIFKAGGQTSDANTYSTDSQFTASNVAKIRDEGIPVGTYYYARHINTYNVQGSWSELNAQTDAIIQANNYADCLEAVFGVGKCGDLRPVLDFEDNRIYDDANYVTTGHICYTWIKAFNDRMKERFTQLGDDGCILYTAKYYVDASTSDDDYASSTGDGISTELPYLWVAVNVPDEESNHPNTSYPNYNFTQFGDYSTWCLMQYSSDRNRMGVEYQTIKTPLDVNVFDNINYDLNDILVYDRNKPKLLAELDNKADKQHTHAGDYLSTVDGHLMGRTTVNSPDGFILKQEKQKSWKIGRTSESIVAGEADDIQFIPSSDTWYSSSSANVGETWDSGNAIVFDADGAISVAGSDVVTEDSLETISPSPSGNWFFLNGANIKADQIASLNNASSPDKYVKLCRIKHSGSGTYGRGIFELYYIHTGTNIKVGKLKMFAYKVDGEDTAHSTSYFKLLEDENSLSSFSAGDVVWKDLTPASGNIGYIDVFVKVGGYARCYANIINCITEGNVEITMSPDGTTLISSIPAENDTEEIDSVTYTYGADNNFDLVTASGSGLELLDSTTLSATATSYSVSVSASDYTNIIIEATALKVNNATPSALQMTFNSITTGVYYSTLHSSDSTSISNATSGTYIPFGNNAVAGSAETASTCYINVNLATQTAKYTTNIKRSSVTQVVSGDAIYSGTSEITSIQLKPSANSFAIGTTFNVYGVSKP